MIDDYLHAIAAEGQRQATLRLRRDQLQHMARCLGCAPDEVTAERLIEWFGKQTHWSAEHRRSNRSAVRGFFSWAHKSGRVQVYLGDVLPKLPQAKMVPRPVPDDVWVYALAMFMGSGGPQLLVQGKGGRRRIVPISEDLARLIRRGAAGHTPALAAYDWGCSGWLFPDGEGSHLSAARVGAVVARALPGGYSMHSLRHRFATRAYRGSRNLLAVQTLLGHASVASTQRYTEVADDEIRAAAATAWDESRS
ncbi:tyrosine-type recombinase/integrase [Mycobacterium avium]|uniref:tyrosine-type recombinase/integrase n=1 Tax=Mycobacterium avium TaxID=1764 RepID=UPI001EED4A9E|nr:tyrosine-type recombinase/integrase [Mycobacterium avium]